jgi:glycosyltransferase involved in cell wall biosynthesis
MEAFVLAIGDWLHANTAHQIRICFKLVSGQRPNASLMARCQELGLDIHFVDRASRALVGHILWADVVHGNNCSPDVVLTSKVAGKPLVLTVHNYLRETFSWRSLLWIGCSRLADWRTYNSNFVRTTWESGAVSERSEVIPTVSHLPVEQVGFGQRAGFLFVARLIENKGLDILLQAYEQGDFDKTKWPLRIAGDGPLRGWLDRYIAERGQESVTALGFLSEPAKASRIASARWLVAPANTREDMGLTPIEARNVAVPAIVTRDGGLPESGGPAALLCDPGAVDSLQQALETAARMPMEEYVARSNLAKESLKGYLRPISDYVAIYARLRGTSA